VLISACKGLAIRTNTRMKTRDVMLNANAQSEAVTHRHWIDGDGGVRLGVQERQGASAGAGRTPVLIVHGATLGAALFDIPLPGYSLMSELARRGHDVYALDIRGYGHSLTAAVMDRPSGENPPFARLDDALQDVAATAAFVRERTQSAAVDLIGFSWGSIVAARFAGTHPENVRRLILYAPLYAEKNELWRLRIGDPRDPTRIVPDLGAYRLVAREDIRKRWDADIGSDEPERLRADDMPDVIFDVFAKLDPLSDSRVPPAFRSPTGALADLIQVFNGKPLYDPGLITMPTLLVRGADDTTSTDPDSRNLLAAIAASYKDYQVIAPGSHFLCVEKNRHELYERIGKFLESPAL
jgi:pimeloyl-ACP methyl ester carboxylesterase